MKQSTLRLEPDGVSAPDTVLRTAAGERARRREVQCFWAGIATSVVVAAYRVYATVRRPAADAASSGSLDDVWVVNGVILWSLTLFILAWFFWRDARRRQDELSTVVRSIIPDVLLVLDAAGAIWMCNPAVAVMFGYSPEEVLGRESDTLIGPRSPTGAEREVYSRLHRSGHEVGPAVGLRKDGTRFPAEVTTARLVEQKGAVMMIRDISERIQVEQLRENLNHTLVHDLRNPLFGISGNLHLIRALSPHPPEGVNGALEIAVECVADIEETLRCMVDLTRLESGAWDMQIEDCDLGELTDQAVVALAPLAREKRHTVVWEKRPARCRADVKLIGQAARHLVRNAIEPTPSGGRIEIRIETTASGLRLCVADNGPGVPPAFQSKSFEKSGAVQNAEARRRSVGLGLVFCRLAVGLHGGSVGVESRGDEGSTFWFELPAKPMAPAPGDDHSRGRA